MNSRCDHCDCYHGLLMRVAPILIMVDSRRGGIGGMTVTSYECAVCGEEKTHSNTAIPIVCPDCRTILREMLRKEAASR